LLRVEEVDFANLDEAPAGPSNDMLRVTNSPARELSTTSTPRPFVSVRISSAKASERESRTCSTPRERRRSRFRGLPAVVKISAPARWASWIAAKPTPPAPAWMRTRSPGFKAPKRSNP